MTFNQSQAWGIEEESRRALERVSGAVLLYYSWQLSVLASILLYCTVQFDSNWFVSNHAAALFANLLTC